MVNTCMFFCIDIFSKYAYGIEMPNKRSNSTALALSDVFNKTGIPKVSASDEGRCKQILDAERIAHIIMTTHLSCIDRFTRTSRNMLFERVEHTKEDWHLLPPKCK